MQLLMVRFDERTSAEEALGRLRTAVDDEVVAVDDIALVYKSDKGKVHVEQTRDVSAAKGAGRGAVLGAALGLVTGGIGAVAAAGAAGGGALAHRDSGVSNKVIKRIGDAIEGSEAVVFVAADDDAVTRITSYVDERHRTDLDYLVMSASEQYELRTALE